LTTNILKNNYFYIEKSYIAIVGFIVNKLVLLLYC